jgi:uncharacterized secreted protein with C-terminal beta-propeller domain
MKGKLIVLLLIAISSCIIISTALPPSNPSKSLKKFSSCEEIMNFLKANRGVEIEIPYSYFYSIARNAAPSAFKSTFESTTGLDYSTTNIQVAGVDEADIVKNDGKYIYTISGSKIVIIDAYPAEQAKILSEIEFNGTPLEIFINKDRLIVFGEEQSYYHYQYPLKETIGIASKYPYGTSKTSIKIYDISDRENPKLARNLSIDGNYYDSRMIGDYVYAVVNKNIYDYGEISIPRVSEGETSANCKCSDVYYFDVPDSSYFFSTIVAINTQNEEKLESKVFLMGYTQQMYVSLNNIFITYQKRLSSTYYYEKLIKEVIIPVAPIELISRINEISSYNISMYSKLQEIQGLLQSYTQQLSEGERTSFEEKLKGKISKLQEEIAMEMQKTAIHKISINGNKIEYKAEGEVPGVVLNQFSMDEYNNHFRVATTTWNSNSQSKNHVYILDSDLKIAGKLEDLAPGERIYSARFLGDRCYLVTFKKVDPLFVINLSNPRSPEVLGKLKIPGYSDYLHPYDENHLIGIGKEAVEAEEGDFAWYQGVKLSLFDVSKVSEPREIAKYSIGDRGTDSYALRDHKAFLFSKSKNLLVIPILLAEIDEQKYSKIPPYIQGDYIWQGAYVFEPTLKEGFVLKGRITHNPSEGEFKKSGLYFYYYSPYSIKRSLYIENTLYTISDKLIKANALPNLEELKSISLE